MEPDFAQAPQALDQLTVLQLVSKNSLKLDVYAANDYELAMESVFAPAQQVQGIAQTAFVKVTETATDFFSNDGLLAPVDTEFGWVDAIASADPVTAYNIAAKSADTQSWLSSIERAGGLKLQAFGW